MIRTSLLGLGLGVLGFAVIGLAGCKPEEMPNEAVAEETGIQKVAVVANGPLSEKETFASIKLRGYGQVSGILWESEQGSVLQIDCEDEEKARLTHAKYISDLQTTPYGLGQVTVSGGTHEAWTVEGQGVIAALRSGTQVFLLSSPQMEGLQKNLTEGLGGDVATASSKAEGEVPMWLDRWDQFGFRFYYRPGEKPQDAALKENYDENTEFEFAEKSDRSGFVFWGNSHQVDSAEGLTNYASWDYAAKAAAAKKLPVGLNLMVGGPGMGWFYNRYREQDAMKMPQYCGTYHKIADDYFGGSGFTSWNATTAEDANLGLIQKHITDNVPAGNVTTILEPHGELKHGDYDIFMEYGPVADEGMRDYLKTRYVSIDEVNTAWGTSLKSWDEVRVPEVASFMGWGPQALDLSGTWRIAHEPGFDAKDSGNEGATTATSTAPPEWFSDDFDDSSWATVEAPGHDRTMFLPKKPAVYRRTLDIQPEWLKDKKEVWFYLWDLNTDWKQPVQIHVNGKLVGEDICQHPSCHHMAVEVSSHLKPGSNQISIRVPSGYIAYRTYLSPDKPLQYPSLGKEKNALWVDFIGWIRWSRVDSARRGMEMIRQVQPDIQIDLMAPDSYEDGIKELAQKYGGNFKNTGYMGAFWADHLPSHMRSAGLPFSLEPGAPAGTLTEFKKQLGLYQTEGIQGIDYFIHIGSIMWNPEIRAHFEKTLKMTRFLGKHHPPRADVAFLWGTENKAMVGFPWGKNLDVNLPSGYNCKDMANQLLWRGWQRDVVSESDFGNGNASKYKVIIDTNTSIMDADMLKRVEDYVRGGGTFVTFLQTGRHSPTVPDSWPISELTGYEVISWDHPISKEGSIPQSVKPAAGQDIYPAPAGWMGANRVGLRLKKVTPDAQDLLLWADGTVAAGIRPLGKGNIIHFGPREGGDSWPGIAPEALEAILQQKSAKKTPAHFETEQNGRRLLMRHYETNNGLYDVWAIWNQSNEAVKANLIFDDRSLDRGYEIETGRPVSFSAGRLADLSFEPLQTRLFLTPRKQLSRAPSDWFSLQRSWWKATSAPPTKALPAPPHMFSVDLSEGWSFLPLGEAEDGAAFSASDVDDSAWEKIRLGLWTLPDKRDIKHAVLRKTFTVPEKWSDGEVELWIQDWQHANFFGRGRVWLDGKLIHDWNRDGIRGTNPGGVLLPGGSHTITMEIDGKDALVGSRGPAWLSYLPKAAASLDLGGEWSASQDVMHYDSKVTLPGDYQAKGMRRNVVIPKEHADKKVLVDIAAEGQALGILINGRWIRRFHHIIGTRFQLNVTPWVKFGEKNEIEIIQLNGPGRGKIQSVNLRFYSSEQDYP